MTVLIMIVATYGFTMSCIKAVGQEGIVVTETLGTEYFELFVPTRTHWNGMRIFTVFVVH